MIHHKKKKKHDDLPGAGIHPAFIAYVPSRPPSGCEGHGQMNQLATNIAGDSGHPCPGAPAAPSAPAAAPSAPAAGPAGD